MKTYNCAGCGAPVRGDKNGKVVCTYCGVENVIDKKGLIHLSEGEIRKKRAKGLLLVFLLFIGGGAFSGVFYYFKGGTSRPPHVLGEKGVYYARYPVNVFSDKKLTSKMTTLALAEQVTGGHEIEFEDSTGSTRTVAEIYMSDMSKGYVERRHLAYELVVFTQNTHVYEKPVLDGSAKSYWVPRGMIAAVIGRKKDGWIKVDIGEFNGKSIYGVWAKNSYSYDKTEIIKAVPEQTRLIKGGKLQCAYDPGKEMEALEFCSERSLASFFQGLEKLSILKPGEEFPEAIKDYGDAGDWHWSSGGEIRIYALSKDSRYAAVEHVSSLDAVGNTTPDGMLFIVDIIKKKAVEKIISSYASVHLFQRHDCTGIDTVERTEKLNSVIRKRLDSYLADKGFRKDVREAELPLTLKYDAVLKDGAMYTLKFYLSSPPVDKKYYVATRSHGQHGPSDTKIGKIYVTRDGMNFIALYHTPSMMEFHGGDTGVIVINKERLAYVYNAVGHELYRKGQYKPALDMFNRAAVCDNNNPTPVYNGACMNALMGNARRAADYLRRLTGINTKEAKAYLEKAKKDKDFDGVREDPALAEFMK